MRLKFCPSFCSGIFISHLESLAQTDSQALKRAEIEGFTKKWQQAKFPLHIALYLDVLTPLKVLSVSMQKEDHDPVLMLRRIQEFGWTMSKLQTLVLDSLDGSTRRLTNYTKFLGDLVRNEEGEVGYQSIQLKNFDASQVSLESSFADIVAKVSSSVEKRFSDIKSNPLYNSLVTLLDVNSWPTDHNLADFGDNLIFDLMEFWKTLLETNGCVTENIPTQWDELKNAMKPLITGRVHYMEAWSRVFTNSFIKETCSDVLHIFELLMITPSTNAKLERMFSRMNRIKTDWRNKLKRERLENCLRISEEGCAIQEFKPDKCIDRWYQQKVRRISAAKRHDYPVNRKKSVNAAGQPVDIAQYTISDMEDSEESDLSENDGIGC